MPPSPPSLSAPVLAGVRVLDLTNVLAGPFCTYQLALLGAEVIKVETPGTGDLARQLGADAGLSRELMGASFLAQNAGKKSITLNLKHDAGKEIFRRLVPTADVLVENFRPGVMDRLGLGHDNLKALHPSLVYCAISGFGQEGPMRDAPAYDQIIQGLSGVMSITGSAASAPLRVGYPVSDSIGGLTAALAICAALAGDRSTRTGRFIDVSMLEATIATMGWVVSNYLLADQRPAPLGNDNFTAAPSGTFRTARGLLNIAANKQEQFVALMKLLGRPELATDPRFAGREDRKRNRQALTLEMEKGLLEHPADHWETVLNRAGVPAGRVLTVPEALDLPQVRERHLVRRIEGVKGSRASIDVVRGGYTVSGMDAAVTSPPPALGEHTDEILASLGFSEAEIAACKERNDI